MHDSRLHRRSIGTRRIPRTNGWRSASIRQTGRTLFEGLARAVVDVLADGGRVLMPLGDYGFSRAFAWVDDRFEVSWQLNLPAALPA